MSATEPDRYDLSRLPAAIPEVDFGLHGVGSVPGFGEVWVAYVGRAELASRGIEPDQWQDAEVRRYRVLEAASRWVLATLGGMDGRYGQRKQRAATGDLKAGKLAVVTLLHALEDGDRVPHQLAKALMRALDIEKQVRQRARRTTAARLRPTLEHSRGLTATEAVKVVSLFAGVEERTVRGFKPTPLVPASEAWFEASADAREDHVAAAIVNSIEEHGPTLRLRWDVWELLEGYFRRRWAPTPAALAALAHALDLVRADGRAKPLPLGGVVHRWAFMLAADVAAETSTSARSGETLRDLMHGTDELSEATLSRWPDHPLRPAAMNAMRRVRHL